MSYRTMVERAKRGELFSEIVECADFENVTPEKVAKGLAEGTIVICKNCVRPRNVRSVGFGGGLTIKVNANIGTSEDCNDIEHELAKLDAACEAKADAVMDLSTGGDLVNIRRAILEKSSIPVGTVPIYEVAVRMKRSGKGVVNMTADDIFDVIELQAQQGVDFMTIHAGLTMRAVELMFDQGRTMNVVSRGGAFLVQWMARNERENPLLEQFDRLLDICRRYEITLSLGDGMRPGAGCDATDRAQIEELLVLGDLINRCRKADVQAMVEGPGHVPIDQIETNMRIQKSLCQNAPFYVLGPLVTDIAPGYDHIVAAIGGAWAAYYGADFLCYVTATEHLALPDVEAVRSGVIVSRIAAHAADVARKIPSAVEWDRQMSLARFDLDWEKQLALAIDPEHARKIRERRLPLNEEVCTMCGDYCAVKGIRDIKLKK